MGNKPQKQEDRSYYYEFLEKLGEGAFCTVHRAIYKVTGEPIAVKVRITGLLDIGD
jgi:serine/threonine protein kinase